MATIADLKTQNEANIKSKTAAGSITPVIDGDERAKVLDEIRARGVIYAADTTELGTKRGDDTAWVLVPTVGLFAWLASGTANGTTIFAAADSGVWVLVMASAAGAVAPDVTPPGIVSITAVDANTIRVVFTENTTGTLAGWSFTNNGSPLVPSGVTGSGTTTWDFATTGLVNTDVLLASYDSGTGDAVDGSGNALASFTDSAVTNSVTPVGFITTNRIIDYRFLEGSGQRVFNQAGPNTANDDLFGIGEGYFANRQYLIGTTYFQKSASGYATVTDNYAAAPSGNNNSARLQTLAGAFVSAIGEIPGIRTVITLPAGTYTVSLAVKSNTASAQFCRMEIVGGTISSDLNVTTAWTRISFTFTTSGGSTNIAFVRNDSAGNALDILISDLKINVGSSATSYVGPVFDILFGINGVSETKDPTWVAGKGIAITGSQNGTIISSTPASLSTVTMYAAAKLSASTSNFGYLLNTDFNETQCLWMSWGKGGTTDDTSQPLFKFNNTQLKLLVQKLADDAVHIVCMQYDGTNIKIYIDNILLKSAAATISPITLKALLLGDTAFVGGRGFDGEIYYASIYDTAHSSVEIAQMYSAIKSELATRGITAATPSKFILWEGDSISSVGSSGIYPRIATRLFTTPIWAHNVAVVGDTLTQLNARATSDDAFVDASRTSNILFVLIGANDLGGVDSTTFYNNLKTYCNARRAAGWKVVACTVLPNTNSGFNTKRNAANDLIRGDSSFYDALCDFAADATMGPDAAASDTSLYGDGVHPTAAGHAILGPIAKAAIDTILV